jgi:hypothetical protein
MAFGAAGPGCSEELCASTRLGRGRDEDCSSPPAQIRTCGFPASGSCLRSNEIGLRGIGYPCSSDPWARRFGDMRDPALCPGHASQLTLPSTGRLPSTVSAADVTRHCSRLYRYYAAVRLLIRVACPSFGCCLHGPVRRPSRTRMRSPRFQRKDVSTCMGSPTARGSSSASQFRGEDVAFRPTARRQHLGIRPVSQLNTQPVVSPVNASSWPSRAALASLGAGAAG